MLRGFYKRNGKSVWIAVLLLFCGIPLLLSPIFSQKKLDQNQRKMLEISENVPPDTIAVNQQSTADFVFEEVEELSSDVFVPDTATSETTLLRSMIGLIHIPSLGLKAPLLKGTNNENLLAGICTMREDQKMGEGNYPLAGHYTKKKDSFFGGLLSIDTGAVIKITDKTTIYTYRVAQYEELSDTAIEAIEDPKAEQYGAPVITLMTCKYSSQNGIRVFVTGLLEQTEPFVSDEQFYGSEL